MHRTGGRRYFNGQRSGANLTARGDPTASRPGHDLGCPAASPDWEFRIGDAEDLPFADESFGAVSSSFAMEHSENPERALAEAFRVLQPGGRIADRTVSGDATGWRALAAHGQIVKRVREGVTMNMR